MPSPYDLGDYKLEIDPMLMPPPSLSFGAAGWSLSPDPDPDAEIILPPLPVFQSPPWHLLDDDTVKALKLPAIPPARPSPYCTGWKVPEAAPRPGEVKDLLKAVYKLPCVQQASSALQQKAETKLKSTWGSLNTGQKVAVGISLGTFGVGALSGAIAHPKSRDPVLSFINGKQIPVPKIKGLSLSLIYKDIGKDPAKDAPKEVGGMLHLDLMPYLRGKI